MISSRLEPAAIASKNDGYRNSAQPWEQMIRYRDVDALRVNFCKLFVQSGEAVAVEIVHTYKKDPLVKTFAKESSRVLGVVSVVILYNLD